VQAPLADLGLANPVLAAPMAGGPTTPALVTAAARAGSLGFLAGGYKTPELLAEQVRRVRADTPTFGVNLFAPNPIPVDATAFRLYARAIQPAADEYELDLELAEPVEDDDHWAAKIALLIADPVPVVSFTFGIPDAAIIRALQKAGSVVVQTVTSAAEARLATDADVLAVQSAAAGGHSGTLTPERRPEPVPLPGLIATIRSATRLPLVAAGGLGTPAHIAEVVRAGADAVMVGTALLRTDESGASAVHRAAVADPARGETVMTRAFTGRPARALRNTFIERYDAIAPTGYPALHYLTSPLRRAAAAAGNPEAVNLWAGTGYRHAAADSVQTVLTLLASAL
jgi:NAD(P)H-dependent flavin oxidoreductase YrpB (nitropropane dioxygenase family)